MVSVNGMARIKVRERTGADGQDGTFRWKSSAVKVRDMSTVVFSLSVSEMKMRLLRVRHQECVI